MAVHAMPMTTPGGVEAPWEFNDKGVDYLRQLFASFD